MEEFMRIISVFILLLAVVCKVATEHAAGSLDAMSALEWNLLQGLGQPVSFKDSLPNDYNRHLQGNDSEPLTPSNSTDDATYLPEDPDYSAIFHTFNPIRYEGLDHTSEYAASVAITADYIVVGANGYDNFTGIVHVYTPENGTKLNLHSLIRAPPGSNINFGVSVAIDGTNIAIGANAYNVYTGIAYLYSLYEGQSWIARATFYSPAGYASGFGRSIAISGTTVVIGTSIGKAYIYEKKGKKWSRTASLEAPNSTADSGFGRQISIYNDLVVIGASQYNDSWGGVFVFMRDSTGKWDMITQLTSVTGYNSFYGQSVAVYNRTIAVGAVGYQQNIYMTRNNIDYSLDPNNTGWVYLYEMDRFDPLKWTLATSIQSPVGRLSYFGQAVALNNYYLAVGADGYPFGQSQGSIFMYNRVAADNYNLTLAYQSPAQHNEYFGRSVSLSDQYSAVGGAFAYNQLQGAIYVMPLPKPPAPTGTSGGTSSIGTQPTSKKSIITTGIIGILIILVLLVLIVAAIIYTCGWNCCCCVVPIIAGKKKKKKKDEEDSPYTVHSYVGYSEIDDNYSYNSSVPTSLPRPMMPPQMKFLPGDKEKEKLMAMEGSNKRIMLEDGTIVSASEEYLRQLFPYKVYSFAGYHEDKAEKDGFDPQRLLDEKVKNDEVARNTAANSRSAASMFSSNYSISSDGSSDYFGDNNRIYSEESVMNQIRSQASVRSVQSESEMSSSFYSQNNESQTYGGDHSKGVAYGLETVLENSNESETNSSSSGSVQSVQIRSILRNGSKTFAPRIHPMYLTSDTDGSTSSRLFAQKNSSDEKTSSDNKYISPDDESARDSNASYVHQAKAHYTALLKAKVQSNNVSSDSSTSHSALQTYNMAADSSVSGLNHTSSNSATASSFVEQARFQYASIIKARLAGADQATAMSDVSSVESSAYKVTPEVSSSDAEKSNELHSSSQEEIVKVSANTVASTQPVVTINTQASSLVAQARAKYSAAMARLNVASESSDLSQSAVETAAPHALPEADEASLASDNHSQATASSSSVSVVEQARSKYADFLAQRKQKLTESTMAMEDMSVSSGASSIGSQASIVQKARAQYAEMLAKRQTLSHSGTVSTPQEDDEASEASKSSIVDAARAQYASVLAKRLENPASISDSAPLVQFSSEERPAISPNSNEKASVQRFNLRGKREESKSFGGYVSSIRKIEEVADDDSSVSTKNVQETKISSGSSTASEKSIEDSKVRAAAALALARQRLEQEEMKARESAQNNAQDEDVKRAEERNRLKEEARIRAEERARARFAMFKAKAEENAQPGDLKQVPSVIEEAKQTLAMLTPSRGTSTELSAPAIITNVVNTVNTVVSSTTVINTSVTSSHSAMRSERSSRTIEQASEEGQVSQVRSEVQSSSHTTTMQSSGSFSVLSNNSRSTHSTPSTIPNSRQVQDKEDDFAEP